MNIGILAVQGAFIEHAKMLEKLNVSSFEIRKYEYCYPHDARDNYCVCTCLWLF